MNPAERPIRSRPVPFFVLLLVVLLLIPSPRAVGYFPITISGVSLSWANPDLPVTYVINASGSDDIPDRSEDLALRLAFDRWENLTGSDIAFLEDTGADATRTDYGSSDIHLILFDETDATGFFPGASGTVALTPITFNSLTGQIIDADIIFNGNDHSFSTDKTAGTFDVQAVAAHEIGHFLGLDHSASCASTMFPFAEATHTSARSLTADDAGGAREIYPSAPGSTGSISGTVERASDASAVGGAHVAAVDANGIVVTTTYAQADGTFVIPELPAGSYTVFAEPLDQPVMGWNLSSSIGGSAATDFQTTYLGGNATRTVVAVSNGFDSAVGTLSVDAPGSRNLLAASDFPVVARRNALASLVIEGTGLQSGDTISITGTGVTVFFSSYSNAGANPIFSLILQVSAAAELGPRNLEITSGSDFTLLTGLIEVVEPFPTITGVAPTQGPTTGGTSVTLTGTDFQAGSVVIFGDAEATSVSVDSATQITATAPPGTGTVDIFVEAPDGQVDEESAAFEYIFEPIVTSVYPAAGSDAGGTAVTIHGLDFAAGATVTFDGAAATVTAVDAVSIACTTPPGTAGAVNVVVTNPGGLTDTLTNGFTYRSADDPTVKNVTPASGPTSGATPVTLNGSGFQAGALVYLGRDAAGGGGVLADAIVVVSDTEIQFTTPSQPAGAVAVTVENPDGSVARLGSGFTYVVPGGGGGGGGGCFALPILPLGSGGGGSGPILGGLLPYLLMLLVALAFRQHAARARLA